MDLETTATADIPQVLPKEIDAGGYEGPIVFSYQGAFGPPTYGHYVAMKLMALQVCKDYPIASKITMLFMPTPGGSKKHLNPTRDIRIEVLKKFCELLASEPEITEINDERTRLVFEPSKIEYSLAGDVDKGISTISTIEEIEKIEKIEKIESKPLILIGMGYDNMLQLPYWESVKEYHKKVARIYVVYRELTKEEKAKTRLFRIVGPGKGGDGQDYPVLSFETIVPSWSKDLTSITVGFDIGPEVETTATDLIKIKEYNKRMAEKFTESAVIYNYKLELPTVVTIGRVEVVDKDGNKSYESAIPPTSSSMLRYFINRHEDKTSLDVLDEYIKRIMFGPRKVDEELKKLEKSTITAYANYDDVGYVKKYTDIEKILIGEPDSVVEPTTDTLHDNSMSSRGGTKKKRRKPRKSAKKGRRTGKKRASNRHRNKQTLRKYR